VADYVLKKHEHIGFSDLYHQHTGSKDCCSASEHQLNATICAYTLRSQTFSTDIICPKLKH